MPSLPPCPASDRRSSRGTATTCWRWSLRPHDRARASSFSSRREQEVEEPARIASDALIAAAALALAQLEGARVGQRPQAPLPDQLLVDAAEATAVRRVDRHG